MPLHKTRQEKIAHALKNDKTLAFFIHNGCGPTVALSDCGDNLDQYHRQHVVELYGHSIKDPTLSHLFERELELLTTKYADARRYLSGEKLTDHEMLNPRQ